jgi:outer membrane protein TolC
MMRARDAKPRQLRRLLAGLALCALAGCMTPMSVVHEAGWRPEQQTLAIRDPAAFPPAPLPKVPPPITVADAALPRETLNLSLNEAVKITLENAKAVRVFTGLGASNSGRTIYDAAIANTAIDQAQGRFDPALTASNALNRNQTPQLGAALGRPFGVDIVGPRTYDDRAAIGLNKVNTLGGRAGLNLVSEHSTTSPSPGGLNPLERKTVEFAYTQPLLQGGGFQFNIAPIVLARLDTERSYFQFKDATQALVRGTIEAYWNLVLARLELWAADMQYEQADEAYKREDARLQAGLGAATEVAQAKVTLNQFRASRIASRANVLAREGALRNILGLPASDGKTIVPVSMPANLRYKPAWDDLIRFAEQMRPDLIELKLVLEADAQRKIQAENSALPQLDATAAYRWNGLSGRLPPFGERLSTDPGQFADWTVGITFSVPLGLREGRARVREQDLIILRDKANLEQGLHAASGDLAITVRGLESTFEQYQAYREVRSAAEINVDVQIGQQKAGRGIYLSVLQALNDWGSAVTSEARTLIDYNILLATLEQQTGTILETHGLVFIEERFQAMGPLSEHGFNREYPRDLKPTGAPTKFPSSGKPGENAFDLTKPTERPAKLKEPVPPGDKKKDPPPVEPKFADDGAK